jgi:Ca2+-binding RTX toxin-like protein
VSNAGDVNGDGHDDIIVGAPGADVGAQADAGKAYVIYGSASGFAATLSLDDIDGTNGFVIEGAVADDELGARVAGAGDVNGDGYDDLLVGASGANSDAGASYVIFGGDFTGLVTQQGDGVLIGTAGQDIIIGGPGNDTITGLGDNDVLKGAAGNDVIDGGAGNDIIEGDTGNDLVAGGAGADDLDGGLGTDTLDYTLSPAAVTVDLATNTVSGGDATGDKIDNFENVLGSAHDDLLTGNALANVIRGGDGNDTQTGGGGADTFEYALQSDGVEDLSNAVDITSVTADTLADFETGSDSIVLDTTAFGLAGGPLVDGTNFSVIGVAYDGTNASNTAYDANAPSVIVDGDGRLIYDANGATEGYTVLASAGADAVQATDVQAQSLT